jgi:3-oxoacyl-[acyl-carrier protein] reductase
LFRRELGRAAALRFAREGTRVAVVDLNEPAARETAAQITTGGGEALAVRADVTCEPDVEAAVAATLERFGRLDVLLACAGVNGPFTKVPDTSVEDWDPVMAVNGESLVIDFGGLAKSTFPV